MTYPSDPPNWQPPSQPSYPAPQVPAPPYQPAWAQQAPHTTPPSGPAHARKQPWWKALWVVALVAAVVGIGIGAAASGGTKTKHVAGPTTYATTSVTATATVEATVTTTPTVIKTIATHTRTATVTYTPPPPKQYGEGTYVVGTDIKPGDYHTSGGDNCYWARLSSLNTEDIIDNSTSSGPQTVEVRSGDKAFQVLGDCTFGRT